MSTLTLVEPDYSFAIKNAQQAREAWTLGRDWKIANFNHYYHGKSCSIRDANTLKAEGYTRIRLKYNRDGEIYRGILLINL